MQVRTKGGGVRAATCARGYVGGSCSWRGSFFFLLRVSIIYFLILSPVFGFYSDWFCTSSSGSFLVYFRVPFFQISLSSSPFFYSLSHPFSSPPLSPLLVLRPITSSSGKKSSSATARAERVRFPRRLMGVAALR